MNGEQFLCLLKPSTCLFLVDQNIRIKLDIASSARDRNLLTLEQIKFVCTTSSKPIHMEYQKKFQNVL